MGVGWSVRWGVGWSVETTPHPAPSIVFKGVSKDFCTLGVGVEEESECVCSNAN